MRPTTSLIATALLTCCTTAAPVAQPPSAPQILPSAQCNARFPKAGDDDVWNAYMNLRMYQKPPGETITVPVGGEPKAIPGLDALETFAKIKSAGKATEEKHKRQTLKPPQTTKYPDFVIAGKTCELVARYGAADIWLCNDKAVEQSITHFNAYAYADSAYGQCSEGDEPLSAQMFNNNDQWNLIIRKNSI